MMVNNDYERYSMNLLVSRNLHNICIPENILIKIYIPILKSIH